MCHKLFLLPGSGSPSRKQLTSWSSAWPTSSASTPWWPRPSCWPSGNSATPRTSRFPTSTPSTCVTCCRRRSVPPAAPLRWGWQPISPRSGPTPNIVDLARDIVAAFRADLSDGVIQQSALHFSLQYQGNPPGLPPMVLCTDAGPIPTVRTPPGLQLDDFASEMHCPARAPVDMYSCGTFADRLFIEHHAHAPARERSLEAIHLLLCSVPAEDSWAME